MPLSNTPPIRKRQIQAVFSLTDTPTSVSIWNRDALRLYPTASKILPRKSANVSSRSQSRFSLLLFFAILATVVPLLYLLSYNNPPLRYTLKNIKDISYEYLVTSYDSFAHASGLRTINQSHYVTGDTYWYDIPISGYQYVNSHRKRLYLTSNK